MCIDSFLVNFMQHASVITLDLPIFCETLVDCEVLTILAWIPLPSMDLKRPVKDMWYTPAS